MSHNNPKVLYLFNRVRTGLIDKIKQGDDHDTHFLGMLRLSKYGIDANHIEIEDYISPRLTNIIRKFINIYYIHILLFPKFFSYDIIFSSTGFGSLLLKSILKIKKPKWVMLDFSITGMLSSRKTLKQKVFYFIVKHADGIVTISKDEEEKLIKIFPEKKNFIKFIPHGIDTSFFSPDKNTKEEKNFILSVGRDPGRDFDTLFKSIKNIDCNLKITARPWNIKHLLPLPKNVTLNDFTPKELIQEYRKASIIILPLKTSGGINDAMGCSTLMEAMAMGKAVIATKTPTMESYITDGENGILVTEGDSDELQKAIIKLIHNEEYRKKLGHSAREFVEKNCEAELFSSRLANFFKLIYSNKTD